MGQKENAWLEERISAVSRVKQLNTLRTELLQRLVDSHRAVGTANQWGCGLALIHRNDLRTSLVMFEHQANTASRALYISLVCKPVYKWSG
jgi:hypothetical protein